MGLLHTAKKKEAKRESDKPAVEARAKHHPAQHKRAEPKDVRNTAAVLPEGQSQQPPDAGSDEDEPEESSGGADEDAGESEAPGGVAQGEDAPEDQDEEGSDPDADQGDDGGGDGGQGGGPPQGGDDSEDPGAEQNTGVMGSPNDDTGAAGPASTDLGQAPISPALREEYERATAALYKALYQNDNIAQAILKGVPAQGPMKVKGVAHLTAILFAQLNKQLRLSVNAPQIVLPFTKDIVAHLLDLIQQVRGTQYSEQEAVGALGMAYEMVMRICGVSKKNVQSVYQAYGRSTLNDHLQKYHATNQFVKGGVDPNGFHNPQLQQQEQAGGAPPQGAAPSPGASGPPPGGPPSGGAPPAGPAPGGMMAQAQQAAGGQ